MKQKLQFLFIASMIGSSIFLINGCSLTEDDTTTLTIYVRCTYKDNFYPYKRDTVPIDGSDIYLYQDLNFATDYVDGITYEHLGNGILKNNITGKEINYWKKELSASSLTFFENLPNGTYGVIVDISKIDKRENAKHWSWVSIRLPENLEGYKYNNALNIVFDIWPYQPWDIGL